MLDLFEDEINGFSNRFNFSIFEADFKYEDEFNQWDHEDLTTKSYNFIEESSNNFTDFYRSSYMKNNEAHFLSSQLFSNKDQHSFIVQNECIQVSCSPENWIDPSSIFKPIETKSEQQINIKNRTTSNLSQECDEKCDLALIERNKIHNLIGFKDICVESYENVNITDKSKSKSISPSLDIDILRQSTERRENILGDINENKIKSMASKRTVNKDRQNHRAIERLRRLCLNESFENLKNLIFFNKKCKKNYSTTKTQVTVDSSSDSENVLKIKKSKSDHIDHILVPNNVSMKISRLQILVNARKLINDLNDESMNLFTDISKGKTINQLLRQKIKELLL